MGGFGFFLPLAQNGRFGAKYLEFDFRPPPESVEAACGLSGGLMKKKVLGRFIVIGVFMLLAIVFFLPNTPLFKHMPGWWQDTMPNRGIALGLDLQGGLHLVFEVDTERAAEISAERVVQYLRDDAGEQGIEAEITSEGTLVRVAPFSDELDKIIKKDFRRLEPRGGGLYGLSAGEIRDIKENSVDQAIETIRNRIDQFGVAEPTIHKQGTNEIVVQLPGVKEPERAIDLIGRTAQLEFKLVDDEAPVAAEMPQAIAPGEEGALAQEFKGRIPEKDEILFGNITDETTNRVVSKTPYLIEKEVLLTGDLLTEARVAIDQRDNSPYVAIKFNSSGARLFENVTGAHVQDRLAIILDGTVYSAPVIRERIGGGDAQISGSFTMAEAKDLAIVLRAGSLPAPVIMLQNVTVGPSLGRDSIEAGKKAGLIGAVLVVLFMVMYYRLSGVIADFALGLNILLLLGAMAWLNATLTLPGIAGIILAIGMAVDSNVLMFERMREEVRAGKTPRAAVDSGYHKAFWTIFDSHVTTLITALVLFQFGTGPIKGFAVTLSLGVSINLFTALVGTKTIFDLINQRREVRSLSI
jgi:preprotein translocase subunit SecD